MFFILSKVFFFLLSPFHWILFLLVVHYFVKSTHFKRKIKISILLIFIIFSNPFLYRTLIKKWQPEQTKLIKGKSYSAGILLGGMVMFDRFDSGYFGNTSDRFIQTANLYHSGVINKIVISGGTGRILQDEPAEADFLLKELIRNGVRKEDIINENKARNTYENALFSKKLLDSLALQPPYILITSAIHMPRSEKVFQKAGFNQFLVYPCDYKVIDTKFDLEEMIIPDISVLDNWKFFLKEMIGLAVYRITGKA